MVLVIVLVAGLPFAAWQDVSRLTAVKRVIQEFGEEALVFFKDITTDPKLNPHPKPEEIMLAFQNDFEKLLGQNPDAVAARRPLRVNN